MSSITNLSAKQLRRAAALKEKIQSLDKELEKLLGSSAKSAAQPVGKRKFKMSAAARAKISAAAKKRWAKVKGRKPSRKARRKMSAAAKAIISAKLKAAWARRKAAKK